MTSSKNLKIILELGLEILNEQDRRMYEGMLEMAELDLGRALAVEEKVGLMKFVSERTALTKFFFR